MPQVQPPVDILSFATMDVFTTRPFKGNQLAVIHLPTGYNPTTETKQAIAREFNFSETIFLYPLDPNCGSGRRISIFTTQQELPFAGHPTIGAACHIFQDVERDINELTLRSLAGPIVVRYRRAERMAEVDVPHDIRIHRLPVIGQALMKNQSCSAKTTLTNAQLPIISIVKGMSFVLIKLPSVVPDLQELDPSPVGVDVSSVQLDEKWSPSFIGCYFYTILSHPNDRITRLRTRMLANDVGEDAATGSAACTLACYLSLKDGRQSKVYQFIIEQGIEMGRASDIHVKVTLGSTGLVDSVVLAGRAVLVTQGSLHLPKDGP